MDDIKNSLKIALRHTLVGESGDNFRLIAWSSDGKLLAAPSSNNTIKVWDTATGEPYRTLRGHSAGVNSVAWSKDSKQLVSCSSNGIVALWDLESKDSQIIHLQKFTDERGEIEIYDIAWDSRTGMFATACTDGNVRLWSEIDPAVKMLPGINAYVNCVAWSPDGRLLAAGLGKKVRVWNDKGEQIWDVDAQYSSVNSIAWSSDSKLIASVGKQTLKIWDVLAQKQVGSLLTQLDKDGWIKSLAFSHDGKLLAAKCQNRQTQKENAVKIIDTEHPDRAKIIATIPEPTSANSRNGIAFHPLENILATQGENDSVIRLWEISDLTTSKKALVVGIDSYKNIQKKLFTCAADAEVVAKFLQENGWDIMYEKALTNEEITLDKLKNALEQLFLPGDRVGADDAALLYFSGLGAGVKDYSWGERIAKNRKGDLVAYDSPVDNTISLEWLYELLQKSPIAKQVVWLDSDFSGQFIETAKARSASDSQTQDPFQLKDRSFISASQSDEFAIDRSNSEGEKNGAFSTLLLNKLRSGQNSIDRLVTTQVLEDLDGMEISSGQHAMVFKSGRPIVLTQQDAKIESNQDDTSSVDNTSSESNVDRLKPAEYINAPKEKVEEIQSLLCQAGHSIKIDGNYGEKTQAAVEQFQSDKLRIDSSSPVNPDVLIQFLRLEPPQSQDTIRIKVRSDTIELEYEDISYSNPNRLTQEPKQVENLMKAEGLSNWQEYGQILFESIINDRQNLETGGSSVLTGYRIAREKIGNKRLRVELDIDPNRMSLHQYKWEYLKDPRNDSPLAVYERSPLYRRIGNSILNSVEASPLRILIVICNPSTLKEPNSTQRIVPFDPAKSTNPILDGLVKIDVTQEKAILNLGLNRLKAEGLVEYDFLDETENNPHSTLDNLRKLLAEKSYHILHIVAHGFLMGDSFKLVMEDANGEHDFVDSQQFKSAMIPDTLQLVVLASCQTAQTDTDNAIRGLGARLSSRGIPAVIAMQANVPIPTAQLFTQYFYDHLARSGCIDMAMAATRFDLYRRGEGQTTGDWGIPVLFMNSGSGQLFDVNRQKAANVAPLQPEIKNYDRLPGNGDPRPQLWSASLENLARQHNLNLEQIALLNSLANTSLRPNSQPLAPPQNRQNIQQQISRDFKKEPIDKTALKASSKLALSDRAYSQIAAALNTGKHIILIGPPGTGKTTIAHDICEFIKTQGYIAGYTLTTATADWTTFDTIGGYVPTPQQTLQFRLGIFLESIARSNWLVIDEINRSDIDKAFGELFTVLSGQQVNLPYSINDLPVSILPAKNWQERQDDDLDNYNYVVHPNWRVIGTMNVYDKSSLFNLSFAFMRRFAFIEIEVPDHTIYRDRLLTSDKNGWFANWVDSKKDEQILNKLRNKLLDLIRLKDIEGISLLAQLNLPANPMMSYRAIGPAIVKDMVEYIGNSYQPGEDLDIIDCLGEAFLLYISPQLDGLDRDRILNIYIFINSLFHATNICPIVLNRIESLYPHIAEWSRS